MQKKEAPAEKMLSSLRKRDPYLDRRSGDDRRQVHSLDYFLKDNPDRRKEDERRAGKERRQDCIRINEWSSVCPDPQEIELISTYFFSKNHH